MIPTLADALRMDPGACFNIELKTFPLHPGLAVDGAAMADAVVAVADRRALPHRISVQSFDWRGPRHLRRVRPDIRLAWLTRAAHSRKRHGYGGMGRIPRILPARCRVRWRRRADPAGGPITPT